MTIAAPDRSVGWDPNEPCRVPAPLTGKGNRNERHTVHRFAHAARAELSNGSTTAREVELISRIAKGDRKAFEELYGLYHRRLARFLTRLTKRYDVAEEVINDTFYIVWKKPARFPG